MNQHKFSIIISVLNEVANIQICLLALQALRDRAEIIVVDGGSYDNTVELATAYADKIAASGQGRARQMNHGASQAIGEILLFLHVDTDLPEHALTLIEQNLSTRQVWGRFNIQLCAEFLVSTRRVRMPWQRTQQLMFNIIAFMMNWRSRLTGIATGDQTIFVTKTAFNNVGGFPEISLMEDIALSRALKKLSPPVCLTAKVKSSARRWQQYGIFKTILLMWSLRLRYWLGADPDKLAELYRAGILWKR
jgi:rSAM/selenodomain-associated transferase 2